jgi:DNA-directed RNA polymerase subunit RPC12/RpoP
MGIRFLCHHCEKRLNVKASQAGAEGQCPHCNGSIVVPIESTIPSALEKQMQIHRGKQRAESHQEDNSIGLHKIDEQVTMDGIPAEVRQRASTEAAKFKSDAVATFDSDSDESTEMFMLDKPKPSDTLGKVDPIAEAPQFVWYFRSHELGEKGPLKSKAMKKHLDNGDVQIGCIVWREDWHDWVPAEKVFPSLVAEVKTKRKNARVKRAFKAANFALPASLSPESEVDRRKRKHQRIFLGAIMSGGVLIVILLFVLFQVVSQ